ncbi:hypothetical protein ACLS0R_17245 [Comamonas jiangduensis]|uniref:hypothetical protein n=1 Tax=Comamonas jiangduensis TaxID=1194168 RepID=UPI003BF8BD5C
MKVSEDTQCKDKSYLRVVGFSLLSALFLYQFYRELIGTFGTLHIGVLPALISRPSAALELASSAFGGSFAIPLLVAGILSCFKATRKPWLRWKVVIALTCVMIFAVAMAAYSESLSKKLQGTQSSQIR